MAERLPVGAGRNTKSPSLSSFGSSPASNEVSNASIDRMNGQAVFQEPDSNGSNNQLLSNGSTDSSRIFFNKMLLDKYKLHPLIKRKFFILITIIKKNTQIDKIYNCLLCGFLIKYLSIILIKE